MSADVVFWVDGEPAQQGSKIPGRAKNGRLFVREAADKKLKPWRAAVTAAAKSAMKDEGLEKLAGPVGLAVRFYFPVVASDPERIHKHTAPDLSKLVRAVEDALTDAGVWEDDARVVEYGPTTKRHGNKPGAVVEVWRVTTDERKAA